MSMRDSIDPDFSKQWQEHALNFEHEYPATTTSENREKKQHSLNHYFQNQNRALFVRDLPFHTTAEVLQDFIEKKLNNPGCVEDALIRFSQQGKTLQVACVLLRSESIVADALEKLHECRFYGRDLRVTVYNNKAPIEDSQNAAVQFSFLANDAQIPLVTEDVVRSHMEELYGPLRDVCIRFHRYSENGIQSGYGFLTFINLSDNDRAVKEVQKKVVHNLQYDCRWSSKCKPVSAPGTLRNKRLVYLAATTPTYGPESLNTVSHHADTTAATSLESNHIEIVGKMEPTSSLARNNPPRSSTVNRSNAIPHSHPSLASKDLLGRQEPEENIRHFIHSAPPPPNYPPYDQSRYPHPSAREYALRRDERFHPQYHLNDPTLADPYLEHRFAAAHHLYDPSTAPRDYEQHKLERDKYFQRNPITPYDRHQPAHRYPTSYDKYERERYLPDRRGPERHAPNWYPPERYPSDRPVSERCPADPRTSLYNRREISPYHPQYASGRDEDGRFQPSTSSGPQSMYRDAPQDIEFAVPVDRYFMGASARDGRRSVHDYAEPRRRLEGRLMENMYQPMQSLPSPPHLPTRGLGLASSQIPSLPSRSVARNHMYDSHEHRDIQLGAGPVNAGPLRHAAPSLQYVPPTAPAQPRPSQLHPVPLLPARQFTDELSMTSTGSLSASSHPTQSSRSMASTDTMANMFGYNFGRNIDEDGPPAATSSSSLSHSTSYTLEESTHSNFLWNQFGAPSASAPLPLRTMMETNMSESIVTSLVTADSGNMFNVGISVDNFMSSVSLKESPNTSQLSANPVKGSDI